MVVYVSVEGWSCGLLSSTVGWARTCVQDQYGRPIAAAINFCPYQFKGKDIEEKWDYYMSITIHELLHTLGISRHFFGDFVDEERKFSPPPPYMT